MILKKRGLICSIITIILGSFSFIGCDKQSVGRTEKVELETNKILPQAKQSTKIKDWKPIFFDTINSKLDV
jgi:hypothetical protein